MDEAFRSKGSGRRSCEEEGAIVIIVRPYVPTIHQPQRCGRDTERFDHEARRNHKCDSRSTRRLRTRAIKRKEWLQSSKTQHADMWREIEMGEVHGTLLERRNLNTPAAKAFSRKPSRLCSQQRANIGPSGLQAGAWIHTPLLQSSLFRSSHSLRPS